MLEYTLACLGSNALYILINNGVVAAAVQVAQTVGAIFMWQSTTNVSFTTATGLVVATTTPLFRVLVRWFCCSVV